MSHLLTISGTHYQVARDRLRVIQYGDTVLDVCLSPVLDGKLAKITSWEKTGPRSLRASLGSFGKAFLGEKFDRLAFWIETPAKEFQDVTYLSDGITSGDRWRTFVSDDHDRLWEKKLDRFIPISSAYAVTASPDGTSGGGMTDPDDIPVHWIWNVHVRTLALGGKARWLGLSIPGPWGIGVTRLVMQRERFSLRFEFLRASCTDGRMPVVYFCPDLADPLDVLDEHRTLSEKLELVNLAHKSIPEWWTNPVQGFGDEWYRHHHEKLITKEKGNILDYLPKWINKTRETTGIHDLNTNLEQGCFRLYGDYRPAENMGPEADMRAKVDAWRADGIRAGFYIHPFIVNTKVPFFKEHPEAFCKPKDPNFLMDYACEEWDTNPKFAPVDWTHPLGRKFILDWVRYILSEEPGCMNFDVLRSNHWRSPDPRVYDFHDADWGVGDMMTFKVQKLLYETAKSIKPDCMVTKIACIDPYMQPTFDAMQSSEDWTHNMQHWYRRTQLATRLLRNTLIYTDPWFVTRTKWSEYYMSYLACNMPECQAATHTTHCYYPSWRPLAEKHYRRRKAGYHLYLNGRPLPSDESRLTWTYDSFEAYRRRTEGKLAGWFATLALGTKCLASYNESQALVAASEARTDWIPLPPAAKLEKVTRVLQSGKDEDYEYLFDAERNAVRLRIEDAAGDVLYYRIRYRVEGA
ncbi:MAG: hypothetical protein V2A58_01945 [Planctomycetota bacterium]